MEVVAVEVGRVVVDQAAEREEEEAAEAWGAVQTAVLGAEVRGIDLADGLTPDQFDEVFKAHLDHQVLFFKEQSPVAPETQIVSIIVMLKKPWIKP